MPQGQQPSALRDWLKNDTVSQSRYFRAFNANADLAELVDGTSLQTDIREFEGRSVLIATGDQLTTALALIELDGVVRRITLLPPDMRAEYLPQAIANAEVDVIVTDGDPEKYKPLNV